MKSWRNSIIAAASPPVLMLLYGRREEMSMYVYGIVMKEIKNKSNRPIVRVVTRRKYHIAHLGNASKR